ncbi:MAG: hypothetical protein ACQEQU_07240 [Spirochaetota bacterium]
MQTSPDSTASSGSFLLCSAGEVYLALPADCIDRMSRPEDIDSSSYNLMSVDTLLSIEPQTAAFTEPKAVVTAINDKQTALIIDQPREIATFPVVTVYPMPALIRLSSSHQLITDALVHEDTIYCIINLSYPTTSEEPL